MAEIIVALDQPDGALALRFLDRVPEARWVKVGSILMTREGPGLVRELADRGLHVFLDLKWHDIPHTVARSVAAAADLSVAMVSVHTLGGMAMLRAAAEAGRGRCRLVGVTVLTSLDPVAYGDIVGRDRIDLSDEAIRLGDLAVRAGLQGVVCSSHEAERIRRRVGPAPWIVVPGIRRASDPIGDQVRTATPEEASRMGATHLVVGRPLLNASDPAAVLEELVEAAA